MEMGRLMGEADWKAAEIRHSTWDMLSLRYLLEIQMEISQTAECEFGSLGEKSELNM